MFEEATLTSALENVPYFPKPSHNGGHYTGKPFIPGAAHSNIPMLPDITYTTHIGLRSVDPPPPPEAFYHYASGIRPGNNTPLLPGIKTWQNGKYGVYCIDVPLEKMMCNANNARFSKYYYL